MKNRKEKKKNRRKKKGKRKGKHRIAKAQCRGKGL